MRAKRSPDTERRTYRTQETQSSTSQPGNCAGSHKRRSSVSFTNAYDDSSDESSSSESVISEREMELSPNLASYDNDCTTSPESDSDEGDASFILPPSSDDLMISVSIVESAVTIYEAIFHFRHLLRLCPFIFEHFCAALHYEEISSVMAETHVALLTVLLREEEALGCEFGFPDELPYARLYFFLLDNFTWPEVLLSYALTHKDMADIVPCLQENYPLVPAATKVKVLQRLVDLFICSNAVREYLQQSVDGTGPHMDQTCRGCSEKTGVLFSCALCPQRFHAGCSKPPIPDDARPGEWVCPMCDTCRLRGITGLVDRTHIDHALRTGSLGFDRLGRYYYFMHRRIFVLGNGEACYYSSRAHLDVLLDVMIADGHESRLIQVLHDSYEEVGRHMKCTEDMVSACQGNRPSALSRNLISPLSCGSIPYQTSAPVADEPEADSGGGVQGACTGHLKPATPTYKLGMEGGFRGYFNHYMHHTFSLLDQGADNNRKREALSSLFYLQAFRWPADMYAARTPSVSVLRTSLLMFETSLPQAALHPMWFHQVHTWIRAVRSATTVDECAGLLGALQSMIRPVAYQPGWTKSIGPLAFHRFSPLGAKPAGSPRKDDTDSETDEYRLDLELASSPADLQQAQPAFACFAPHHDSLWMRWRRLPPSGGWIWLSPRYFNPRRQRRWRCAVPYILEQRPAVLMTVIDRLTQSTQAGGKTGGILSHPSANEDQNAHSEDRSSSSSDHLIEPDLEYSECKHIGPGNTLISVDRLSLGNTTSVGFKLQQPQVLMDAQRPCDRAQTFDDVAVPDTANSTGVGDLFRQRLPGCRLRMGRDSRTDSDMKTGVRNSDLKVEVHSLDLFDKKSERASTVTGTLLCGESLRSISGTKQPEDFNMDGAALSGTGLDERKESMTSRCAVSNLASNPVSGSNSGRYSFGFGASDVGSVHKADVLSKDTFEAKRNPSSFSDLCNSSTFRVQHAVGFSVDVSVSPAELSPNVAGELEVQDPQKINAGASCPDSIDNVVMVFSGSESESEFQGVVDESGGSPAITALSGSHGTFGGGSTGVITTEISAVPTSSIPESTSVYTSTPSATQMDCQLAQNPPGEQCSGCDDGPKRANAAYVQSGAVLQPAVIPVKASSDEGFGEIGLKLIAEAAQIASQQVQTGQSGHAITVTGAHSLAFSSACGKSAQRIPLLPLPKLVRRQPTLLPRSSAGIPQPRQAPHGNIVILPPIGNVPVVQPLNSNNQTQVLLKMPNGSLVTASIPTHQLQMCIPTSGAVPSVVTSSAAESAPPSSSSSSFSTTTTTTTTTTVAASSNSLPARPTLSFPSKQLLPNIGKKVSVPLKVGPRSPRDPSHSIWAPYRDVPTNPIEYNIVHGTDMLKSVETQLRHSVEITSNPFLILSRVSKAVFNYQERAGSVFMLPGTQARRLARAAGLRHAQGYIYDTQSNPCYPVSCWNPVLPRPSISVVWRHRLRTARSFAAVGHLLRVLHCCLKWEMLSMKLPKGVNRSVAVSNGFTTLEVVDSVCPLSDGMRFKYMLRKTFQPTRGPKIRPGPPSPTTSVPETGTASVAPAAASTTTAAAAQALMSRPEGGCSQTGGFADQQFVWSMKKITDFWVDEDDLDWWEVRQYWEKIEKERGLLSNRKLIDEQRLASFKAKRMLPARRFDHLLPSLKPAPSWGPTAWLSTAKGSPMESILPPLSPDSAPTAAVPSTTVSSASAPLSVADPSCAALKSSAVTPASVPKPLRIPSAPLKVFQENSKPLPKLILPSTLAPKPTPPTQSTGSTPKKSRTSVEGTCAVIQETPSHQSTLRFKYLPKGSTYEEEANRYRLTVCRSVMDKIIYRIEKKEEVERRRAEKQVVKSEESRIRSEMLHLVRVESMISKYAHKLKMEIVNKRRFFEEMLTAQVVGDGIDNLTRNNSSNLSRWSATRPSLKLPSSSPAFTASGNVMKRSHLGTLVLPPKKMKSSGDNEELMCFCGTPYDGSQFYVGCNMCLKWYHGRCIGVSKRSAQRAESYVCDACRSKTEQPPSRFKKSPSLRELFCICQKPYDDTQFYIGCDMCGDWLHGGCVGISEEEAEYYENYTCPRCCPPPDPSAPPPPISGKTLAEAKKLLAALQGHKRSWVFRESLGSIANSSSKLRATSVPRDLLVIHSKLSSLQYSSLGQMVDEVLAILEDLMRAHPPLSLRHKSAEKLSRWFRVKYEGIKCKLPSAH